MSLIPEKSLDKAEIIRLPNTLRAKVGGKLGAIDASVLAKAEAALEGLSDQFANWLDEEIEKVQAAYEAYKINPTDRKALEDLYFCIHDLKGLGTTYGYPLVTRVGASFCKMADEPEKRMRAPQVLIAAHVDTINVIIRQKLTSESHPVASTLCKTLEDRVKEFLEA